MQRFGIWGMGLLCVSLSTACGDEGGKAKAGGQSGLEGGCDTTSDSVTPVDDDAQVDALGFSASQVLALVEGKHTATLRFASYTNVSDAELEVELTVDDDVAEAHVGCETAFELPALLSLRSSDGALDVETPATIYAPRPDLAYVNVELARDDLGAWNTRLAELFTLAEDDTYPVRLVLTPDEVSGTFALYHQAHGLQASADCELGSWPAQRVCPLGQRQVALGELVRGFDPRDLVSDFNASGAHELRWTDGSTSLTTELELTGEAFCVQDQLPNANGEPTSSLGVLLPARAHLTSSDGAFEAQMNVELSTTLDVNGARDDIAIVGHQLLALGSNMLPWVTAPDAGIIKVTGSAESGTVDISRITPLSPSTVSADINFGCLNNPSFLGDFESVAHGTW